MNITESTYILGVWFFEHEGVGNIMMTVYKDSEDSDIWKGEIRARTYLDNRVFGSDDRKTFYAREWEPGTTKEQVIKSVKSLFSLYSKAYKPIVEDVVMIEGDGEKMIEELSKKDWAQMKKIDPNDEEDREFCREHGIDLPESEGKDE